MVTASVTKRDRAVGEEFVERIDIAGIAGHQPADGSAVEEFERQAL